MPNVKVCFTEDDSSISVDTYCFKTMTPDGFAKVDYKKEMHKVNVLNEYEQEETDLTSQTVTDICTYEEIETFHDNLITDLYRRERTVKFSDLTQAEKKYFIVPLRLVQAGDHREYKIDTNLIKKVTKIAQKGYKNV